VLKIDQKANVNTWFDREKKTKEKNFSRFPNKSQTIPGHALSIRQILDRFSRGQSLPKTQNPIYTDEDYSELKRMDTMEKLDLLNQTNEFIQKTQNELENPPISKDETSEQSESTSGASDESQKE
jgi:hypothetical protein